MKKFKELNLEEIKQAISQSETLAGVLHLLECHDNTFNRNSLKKIILDNDIDISHLKTKTSKKLYLENPKHCKYCGKEIPYEKRENDFCNSSCAASFNNKGVCKHGQKKPDHSYCLNCGKEITRGRHFCDNTCYAEYERKQYIERWKRGEETGIIGEDGIATAVRKYMFEKNNNSCEICGWHEVNPYTRLVPLQIHHIDGDCKNNSEENLQLLCPNCHALTENFGSRNENCTRIDKRYR